jgi:hypothetical protein
VEWAAATRAQLRAGAPRSLALAVEHIARAYEDVKTDGPSATVPGCLSREFNVRAHQCSRSAAPVALRRRA